MREIVRRLETMTAGQPIEDPYQITFSVVTRGPLEGAHETARYGAAVLDTEERTSDNIGWYDAIMTVVIEFQAWVDQGEQPGEVLGRVLADIQRRMREDAALTEPDDGVTLLRDRQLTSDVKETANQLFIDGMGDRLVRGASFWNVVYKRAIDDPRQYVGQRRTG